MSTKNNKSVATQALMDMDAITSTIKEESKKTLQMLLAEQVKEELRKSCSEAEEDEDDDIEVEDENAEDSESESGNSTSGDVSEDENEELNNGLDAMPQGPMGDEAEAQMGAQEAPETEAEADVDGEGDEADDLSQYQVGDDTYDLTNEKDYDKVVKVYKLLNDDDQVIVRKDGNKINLKDEGNNVEYVLDLGTDEDETEMSAEPINGGENETEMQPMNEESEDIAGFDSDIDDIDDEDENNIDGIINSNPEIEKIITQAVQKALSGIKDESDDFAMNESRKNARSQMKESKEVLFEVDLGYTDKYQDKDPISGLSNNETSKSGKSWHKGVPTGTTKPWAGETKSKGKPFSKTEKVEGSVNEEEMPMEEPIEEGGHNVGGAVQERSKGAKTAKPNGRKSHGPKSQNNVSTAEDGYIGKLDETKKALNKALNENKMLSKAVMELKSNLQEAMLTNVNLGKITKLFLENTTSQSEKVEIVNRFCNEAKTIEQSNMLYESIKKSFNKNASSPLNINETSVTAKGTQELNESKMYQSNSVLKTIDLMKRIDNC